MNPKLSRPFYAKAVLLIIFVLLSVVASFAAGKKFGSYLMGDLRNEEKFQSAVEKAQVDQGQYSPLVSPRFKYNPEEYPRDEYGANLSDKPEKSDIVEESPNIEMNYVNSEKSTKNLFDLGEDGDEDDGSGEQPKSEDEAIAENVIYKVLVGTYPLRENAEGIYKKLRNDGYDPYIEAIVNDDVVSYRVQLGAFKNLDNANALAEELRKKGYNAWTRISKS